MIETFKSGWITIDQVVDPGYYVRFMDRVRARDAEDPASYRDVLDLLRPRTGTRFLEVGCGLGGAARASARAIGSTGYVVGLDKSLTMIREAKARTARLTLPVEFHAGDAHRLPFAADSFDGCYSIGMFEIIDDPALVLAEMVRVTRTGGYIVISAPDMGTFAIDSGHRSTTREIMDFVCDHETNGWIGRQLPALCKEIGLTDVTVVSSTSIIDDYDYLREFWLQPFAHSAQAAGATSAEAVAVWLGELEQRAHVGGFFAAITAFTVAGRKQ
jgi:ubiquinone/menaquinone biosynthesis C-methylase UbiE